METYKRPFKHLTLTALTNTLERLESYKHDSAKPLIADILEELNERGYMRNTIFYKKHFNNKVTLKRF